MVQVSINKAGVKQYDKPIGPTKPSTSQTGSNFIKDLSEGKIGFVNGKPVSVVPVINKFTGGGGGSSTPTPTPTPTPSYAVSGGSELTGKVVESKNGVVEKTTYYNKGKEIASATEPKYTYMSPETAKIRGLITQKEYAVAPTVSVNKNVKKASFNFPDENVSINQGGISYSQPTYETQGSFGAKSLPPVTSQVFSDFNLPQATSSYETSAYQRVTKADLTYDDLIPKDKKSLFGYASDFYNNKLSPVIEKSFRANIFNPRKLDTPLIYEIPQRVSSVSKGFTSQSQIIITELPSIAESISLPLTGLETVGKGTGEYVRNQFYDMAGSIDKYSKGKSNDRKGLFSFYTDSGTSLGGRSYGQQVSLPSTRDYLGYAKGGAYTAGYVAPAIISTAITLPLWDFGVGSLARTGVQATMGSVSFLQAGTKFKQATTPEEMSGAIFQGAIAGGITLGVLGKGSYKGIKSGYKYLAEPILFQAPIEVNAPLSEPLLFGRQTFEKTIVDEFGNSKTMRYFNFKGGMFETKQGSQTLVTNRLKEFSKKLGLKAYPIYSGNPYTDYSGYKNALEIMNFWGSTKEQAKKALRFSPARIKQTIYNLNPVEEYSKGIPSFSVKGDETSKYLKGFGRNLITGENVKLGVGASKVRYINSEGVNEKDIAKFVTNVQTASKTNKGAVFQNIKDIGKLNTQFFSSSKSHFLGSTNVNGKNINFYKSTSISKQTIPVKRALSIGNVYIGLDTSPPPISTSEYSLIKAREIISPSVKIKSADVKINAQQSRNIINTLEDIYGTTKTSSRVVKVRDKNLIESVVNVINIPNQQGSITKSIQYSNIIQTKSFIPKINIIGTSKLFSSQKKNTNQQKVKLLPKVQPSSKFKEATLTQDMLKSGYLTKALSMTQSKSIFKEATSTQDMLLGLKTLTKAKTQQRTKINFPFSGVPRLSNPNNPPKIKPIPYNFDFDLNLDRKINKTKKKKSKDTFGLSQYSTSYAGWAWGIRGAKATGKLTGFEIRPLSKKGAIVKELNIFGMLKKKRR